MAEPVLLPGNRYRLNRSAGGAPETFNFVCIASTRSLERVNEYEDVTAPDCATPTAIPWRKSTVTRRGWNVGMGGAMDPNSFANFRADSDSETAVRYQLLIDRLLAEGGGSWIGAIFFENITVVTNDGGVVRWTAQARGDGPLLWVPAAA